jgi:hypothetical protein
LFARVGVKLVSTAVGLEVLAEGWGQSSRPPLAGMLTETRLALTAPCDDVAPPVIDARLGCSCQEDLRRKIGDTVKRAFD